MWARLIRFARRRLHHAGVVGILTAVVLLSADLLDGRKWPEKHLPWLAPILHRTAEARHLLEAVFIAVALAVLLGFFVVRIVSRIFGWDRLRSLSVEQLLVIPAAPDRHHYRLRMAQQVGDTEPFVTWSDAEAEIAARHPGLSGPERRSLYATWFGLRKEAFLLLERRDSKTGRWDPIAVSIVLPLTEHGQAELCSGRLKVVEIAASAEPVIAARNAQSSCLLVDTWIVRRKLLQKKRVREAHEHYAICLALAHVGVFWTGRAKAVLLVEADNRVVAATCKRLGFETLDTDATMLQSLAFPYTGQDAKVRRRAQMIAENVATVRQWPIEGYARPDEPAEPAPRSAPARWAAALKRRLGSLFPRRA